MAIGELVRAGGVVVCEGLAYGLALACRRREPVVVTFGAAGWSSEATAFALGRFASVMLAPSGSRTGRETTSVLGHRVQAYGGNRRVPHVRSRRDIAVVAGSLTAGRSWSFQRNDTDLREHRTSALGGDQARIHRGDGALGALGNLAPKTFVLKTPAVVR